MVLQINFAAIFAEAVYFILNFYRREGNLHHKSQLTLLLSNGRLLI